MFCCKESNKCCIDEYLTPETPPESGGEVKKKYCRMIPKNCIANRILVSSMLFEGICYYEAIAYLLKREKSSHLMQRLLMK